MTIVLRKVRDKKAIRGKKIAMIVVTAKRRERKKAKAKVRKRTELTK